MSVKTLVQEAMNKNVLGFEEALKEELRNRISLALEAKMNSKDEEGEEESDDVVKESTRLDEISGAKLGSYIVKSKADVAARNERGEKVRQDLIKNYPELKAFIGRPVDRKTWMRPKSQNLAVKKLTGDARVPATEK